MQLRLILTAHHLLYYTQEELIEQKKISGSMPDALVRQLKDQLIRAKVYLSLSATRSNPQFIRELRLRMKEVERVLVDAIKDSDLKRGYCFTLPYALILTASNKAFYFQHLHYLFLKLDEVAKDVTDLMPCSAKDKLKTMEQTLAKGRQIQDDCAVAVKKLRAMLHSAEEQLEMHRKQTMFLTQLTAKTVPKGLHCLPLRLTTEYYYLNSSQRKFPNQDKLEDSKLYHYALFSDNVLAAAVVVNSTVSNAKVSIYGHLVAYFFPLPRNQNAHCIRFCAQ